jgi:hypothetical protein
MENEVLKRVLEAYAETGPSGVIRRASVAALRGGVAQLNAIASAVRRKEFNERVSRHSPQLQRNAVFQDRFSGRRVFVLGNGPSLKVQDITWLRDEHVMVCNAFFRHPEAQRLRPDFYFVTDGLLFRNVDSNSSFWRSVCDVVGQEGTLFVPVDYMSEAEELLSIEPHYVALNGFLSDSDVNDVDLTKVIPSPATVVQTAIISAIYMGFTEIVLLGCDHDWLDDFGTDHHFYEGKTASHIPDVKDIPTRAQYAKMLEYVLNLFKGYDKLQALAESRSIMIVNATAGGQLDVFPRVSLGSLNLGL